MIELILSSVVGVIMAVAIAVMLLRRRAAAKKAAEQLKLAVAEGQQIPMSLHPVIDATLCVGSFSCIKACPEGEIIGIVDGVATLVEAAHCIGHGTCAVECPVGAIKLVYGTAERGIDLPESDDSFESSRPGVFVIGELGGMGLIKNALRQGLVLGKVLKTRLKKSEADRGQVDVVIVGSGPAGIAAAVSCKQAGLAVRVFEQDTVGGTIAHYPRGKVVMSEQIVMPNYGPFGKALLSKEDLLGEFIKLLKANKLRVEEGQKVAKIEGDAPVFTVTTEQGTSVQCRAVVLAIGLRGSPQRLGVPGEQLDKVTYRLIEPEQYHGQRVLVVGGGDSAVEAAIQLAEESTAKVSISYRQLAFSKAKKRNREKIERLIAEGRVRALLGTKVIAIEPGLVRIGAQDDKGAKEDNKPPALPPMTMVGAVDDLPHAPGAAADADAQRTMFMDESLQAEVQRELDKPSGASSREPNTERQSSITGRLRVRALDGPQDAPDLGGSSPKTTVMDEAELSALSQRRAPPSVSNLKSNVKIIVGGRARTMGDLEDSAMSKRVSPQDARAAANALSAAASAQAPKGFEVRPGTDLVDRAPKGDNEGRLKNDKVIVSIGGQLPTAFLQSIQVGTRSYKGEEKAAAGGKGLTKAQVEARSRRRLAFTLFGIGAATIAGLLVIGEEYYWLPLEERVKSPLHALLKPSGLWGHGVGVAATTFMLANFIYALRKRWSKLKGTASIRTWLTFHMFVGIMSPLVIAFHAAFLANNLLAVWTWAALSVVVGTGIFGRFLFGLVPAQAGKLLQIGDLRSEMADTSAVLTTKIAQATNVAHVTGLYRMANNAPEGATLVKALIKERSGRKKLLKDIEGARTMFKDQAAFEVYRDGLLKINRARLQISFYAALKRVFRAWLVIHVVVAIFMVVLIGAHVAVTTYLGFRWIFGEGF